MFEIREVKNKTEYNPLLISKQTPFTQAWFYGEWQEMMGRKVRRFEVKKDSKVIGFFQIIRYSLPFNQNLLYIPHGPILKATSDERQATSYLGDEFLKIFRDKLINLAKEENAIFARFDFCLFFNRNSQYFHNWNYGSKENLDKYFKKVPSYAYHSVYFQPKYEWFLDIDKSVDELLSNIHPKNRYGIRLAKNKGVAVEVVGSDLEKYFEDFYGLMEKTAKRNNFKLHPKVYYKNIFENCEKNAFLVLAKYGDKILAINLILLFGEIAYFVFGCSSDEYKNLMAPHLSHWQGIIEAKNRGFKFYNFGAVSSDSNYKELEGISIFKKRFGGQPLEYFDSYDLVLKALWYRLYNLRKRCWR